MGQNTDNCGITIDTFAGFANDGDVHKYHVTKKKIAFKYKFEQIISICGLNAIFYIKSKHISRLILAIIHLA